MCASHWVYTKPKGAMKVKATWVRWLREDGTRSRYPLRGPDHGPAFPGRLILIARRGAPRAYMLGPERVWVLQNGHGMCVFTVFP